MDVIEILFDKNIIIRETDEELYYKIKTELDSETQNFIREKLGYKLIVNQYLIKLEKVPGIPQVFMGISEFNKKIEYVFLCLILIYLETKHKREQFILSEMIDYIKNFQNQIETLDEKIDFNITKQRQSMANVLKYIKKQGFIKLYEGSEDKFSENAENDILYEVTGISKYFVRLFNTNITDCKTYTEIIESENLGLNQDSGIERTNRVYRRLITETVVYNEASNDSDFAYIRQYKRRLEHHLERTMNLKLEVNKDAAYVITQKGKQVFPGTKGISDVVLFVNKELRDLLDDSDTSNLKFFLTNNEFSDLVKKVKEKYGFGFSKEHINSSLNELEKNIVLYMRDFDMLRSATGGYNIMPMAFMITGKYPKDVIIKE